MQKAGQQCILSKILNIHISFHCHLKHHEKKTEWIAPSKVKTEALVAKITYKRSISNMGRTSINLMGTVRTRQIDNSHYTHPMPLHYFTIPPTLLPYKQAALNFQFNISGCELQSLQSKHYPFSCLCHRDSNLLQRGRLDKWEK